MEFSSVIGTILGPGIWLSQRQTRPCSCGTYTLEGERQLVSQCMSKQEKHPILTHAMQGTKIG